MKWSRWARRPEVASPREPTQTEVALEASLDRLEEILEAPRFCPNCGGPWEEGYTREELDA